MAFSSEKVKVWDLFIRFFHWTVVTLFFCNYLLSGKGMPLERGGILHIYAGYIVISFVLARLVWGVIGSHHARFKNFLPTPAEFTAYVRALWRGEFPYYEGHNPAGSVMIVCLLSGLLFTGLTGWLSSLADVFDGSQGSVAAATDFIDWGEVHEFFANLTMLGAGIHITAVVISSHLTGERLIHAMFSGYKKKPE